MLRFAIVLVLVVPACGHDASYAEDPLVQLLATEGVLAAEEWPTSAPGYRLFAIEFDQPVDHEDPLSARFSQHITLLHRAHDAPMILASTGYHNYLIDTFTEPALLLDANQIVVEHRYFASSRPIPTDWSHLTIEQAAADHHRIVSALAPLYDGPWVSTGTSKGGMTSIYHRRFYPDDVDATIAYVAPVSFGAPDDSYLPFFDTVGDSTGNAPCRERVRAFQREALLRRSALEGLAMTYGDVRGLTFARLGGVGPAMEQAIVEFEWSFWQYMGLSFCARIPDSTAGDVEIFDFLNWMASVDFVSDELIGVFEPYFYQTETQLGYPDVPTAHLQDLLVFDPDPDALLPAGVAVAHDPLPMLDVAGWVKTQATETLFVYGEYDPWTAGAFEVGFNPGAHVFTVSAGTHGAQIAELEPEARALALDLIMQWTGVNPNSGLRTALRSPAHDEKRFFHMVRPRPPVRRR